MITRVASVPGTLKKKEILAEYKDITKFLHFTYNPFLVFHLSSKNIKKNTKIAAAPVYESFDGTPPNTAQFFNLLELLATGELSGHTAIAAFKAFVSKYPEYEDVFYAIIDKDLEIRLGDTEINKVFPGLIPTFDVALAESYEPEKDVVEDGKWFISHKLDGCRCIMKVENGNIRFFSREGHEFFTLGKIAEEYKEMHNVPTNAVFDGEICVLDKDGNENFKLIMKEIKKKDHTIQNPMFIVFDMLNPDEFDNKTSERTYGERYKVLKNWICMNHPPFKTMRVLEQIGYNKRTMDEMQKKAKDGGWEGLILRKNCEYKGKRSRDILKVKEFFDAEYKVLDVEIGPFRINTPAGEKTIETLTAVVIEHKGNRVSVGSGFTLDERYEFYKDTKKIIGKVITVQYFEETKNDKGGISLRFPTFKCLHGDKRSV
jgi:DNA ligase-1